MGGSCDVIVVRGGLAGLTSAAYLARSGNRVLLLEQRNKPGGTGNSEGAITGWAFTNPRIPAQTRLQ